MINAYTSYGRSSDQCQLLSVLMQFSYFTGECWLLTISVDLILSLTNPFSSYKLNLRRYHIVVWTSGAIISGVLLDSDHCQDVFSDGICWIDASFECILGFYLFWIVLFYAASICVVLFSAWRISRGLESTYSTRKACVKDTFCIVASYVTYSVFLFLLFILLTPQHNLEQNSNISDSGQHIIAYLLALRGFVDAVLWFMLHDFGSPGSNSSTSTKSKPNGGLWPKFFSSPLLGASEVGRDTDTSDDNIEFAKESEQKSEFGIDIDLSPQLNMALRKEVVHFTTMGIIRSVDLNMDTSNPECASEAVRVFPLEDESHIFSDYEPDAFHRLRQLNNVGERWYQAQISLPAKERLAEGGSGAFMFFCGSGEFMVRRNALELYSFFANMTQEVLSCQRCIYPVTTVETLHIQVKTVEKDEANALLEILKQYEKHLQENADSLLVRFLGLHSLRMYNREFSFVVMRNIFPPVATINQRYDIKGSWVNRNSAPVPPGVRVFCRHCGELFVSGSQASCPDVVGEHEANFVLKDNDFTSKIRLQPDDAYNLIEILNKDSDALCAMGITDFSLLIGIRNLQYEVEPGRIISQRRKSTLTSFSETISSVDIKNNEEMTSFLKEPDRESVSTHSNTGTTQVPGVNPDLSRHAGSMSTSSAETCPWMLKKSTFKNSAKSGRREVSIVEGAEEIPTRDVGLNNKEGSQMLDLMEEELAGGHLARSVIAPGVYYMGIVDILQKWTIKKRCERLYKIHILGRAGEGISCMAPEPYKARFQQKVSQIIEHSIFIREITGSWKGKRELSEPTALVNTT
eukprot:CAMPEP_0114462732 /NCGR_PEP_ID=MMETSP0104-20121206/6983_1 /TAXON_ID=37642 ORGANISM="Paraphysomonas imperforata, Strain PA2" /NCGR_SAMPLE_ID=MMETSP0104 /ASSEMBLY_ACC=CAM_ASM_000202 /LENGTH=801 /DNA_ID=CAMNT_0001635625 /DNA_START=425 /DNA_END=2831 /DNA_ORIENTATION=-